MNNTLIILKPDAVKRAICGKIIDRFEQRGYKIKRGQFTQITEKQASQHYGEHAGKSFFGELVSFITSGPVMILELEGPNVVQVARQMIGATNPQEALPGTIRGDFANDIAANLVHASDSKESAAREIALFFGGL